MELGRNTVLVIKRDGDSLNSKCSIRGGNEAIALIETMINLQKEIIEDMKNKFERQMPSELVEKIKNQEEVNTKKTRIIKKLNTMSKDDLRQLLKDFEGLMNGK